MWVTYEQYCILRLVNVRVYPIWSVVPLDHTAVSRPTAFLALPSSQYHLPQIPKNATNARNARAPTPPKQTLFTARPGMVHAVTLLGSVAFDPPSVNSTANDLRRVLSPRYHTPPQKRCRKLARRGVTRSCSVLACTCEYLAWQPRATSSR